MSKKWLTVGTMAIGIFLCMLDTTVMNIALPAIQNDLHVQLTNLSWALNVYTISFAVFTIPLGQLADILGRNKFYILGLALFLAGSILSGTAGTVPVLIIGRAIQSIGAAVVFPSSMTIGISATTIQQRTSAVAILGVTQGLAAALGPTIGGIVTQFLGWRWVFLINVPLVLLSIGLCLWLLPLRNENRAKLRIDIWGMLIAIIMLFSFTLVLIQGQSWGWHSNATIGLALISVLSFILFIAVERRVKQPMVPLILFQYRQFSGAALSVIVTGVFFVGFSVIMPTFFTQVQNTSELTAALLITPASLMIFFFAPVSGFLLAKIGPRLLIMLGFTLMAVAYGVISFMNPNDYWQVLTSCLLLGSGFGIIAGPIMVLGASDFTDSLLTASQSVLGVLRQIGALLAVTIFVSSLTGNINTAKTQSIHDASETISYLKLPASIKQDVAKEATYQISHSGTSKLGTTSNEPAISVAKEATLVKSTTATVIKNNGGTNLPSPIKIKIQKTVKQDVVKKVNRYNQVIKVATLHIEKHTKNQVTKAFFKPYQVAFPLTIAAIFISSMFKRKRN